MRCLLTADADRRADSHIIIWLCQDILSHPRQILLGSPLALARGLSRVALYVCLTHAVIRSHHSVITATCLTLLTKEEEKENMMMWMTHTRSFMVADISCTPMAFSA